MPFLLTAPPAAEPVSLAEAKAQLRLATSDEDALVAALIKAARHAIEQASGLSLIDQSWSLYVDAWPVSRALLLARGPVSAISDVLIYGEDGTPATLDPAHYLLDKVSSPARCILREGRNVPVAGRRANGIEVRFRAGFGPTGESVPTDLRQALLVTVAHWFDHRGDGEGATLPAEALDLIRFRRVRRLA
jgi:uncharacterized phiE125 gp8 family phage protein